jgi:hypothetical protein
MALREDDTRKSGSVLIWSVVTGYARAEEGERQREPRVMAIARPVKSRGQNPRLSSWLGCSAPTRVRVRVAECLSQSKARKNAPAGNQTRVASMAAMCSATRPLMPWRSRSMGNRHARVGARNS